MKEWVWLIAHPPKKSLEPQQLLLQQGCYQTATQAHSSYICYIIRSLLVLTSAHIVKKENRLSEISMTVMLMSEFIVVIYFFHYTGILVCLPCLGFSPGSASYFPFNNLLPGMCSCMPYFGIVRRSFIALHSKKKGATFIEEAIHFGPPLQTQWSHWNEKQGVWTAVQCFLCDISNWTLLTLCFLLCCSTIISSTLIATIHILYTQWQLEMLRSTIVLSALRVTTSQNKVLLFVLVAQNTGHLPYVCMCVQNVSVWTLLVDVRPISISVMRCSHWNRNKSWIIRHFKDVIMLTAAGY